MDLSSIKRRLSELEKPIPIFMDDINVKAFAVCSDAELDAIEKMQGLARNGLLKDEIQERMGEDFEIAVAAIQKVHAECDRLVAEAGNKLRECSRCHR